MPEFGFRTGTFRGRTVEQAAAELAELGFDNVEVCLEAADVRPEELSEARCREIRATLDRLHIGLASVSYHGDREPYDQRRANQARAVQVARWMGTGILILNPEKLIDRERQWAEHVTQFQKLGRLAQELDVTLALEPEPLLVIGSTQDALDFMAEVGSPQLKINLDIGHAQVTDEDVAASVRSLGTAIVHLHLEDIADRVHRHLPFGQGDIPFDMVRLVLAEVGYSGPYVADLFGMDQDARDVAAQALVDMRRLFG